MTGKHLLIASGVYLGLGLAVAAYTVALSAEGAPHFSGFTADTSAVGGLLQTVFVWPYALFVNVKG